MITKTQARVKAASIKTSIDELHHAVEGLPPGEGTEAVDAALNRLHRKLNGAARRLAEIFEEPIQTFSGGDDRPDEE